MAFDPYYSQVSLLLPMEGANNSTTFADVSPTPKTITRYGDAKILTAESKWGNGSGYFDGSGDYLTVPNGAGFNLAEATAWTVEFWLRPRDARIYAAIVSKRIGDVPTSYHFYINNGVVRFFNGSSAYAGSTLPVNQWTHAAWVFDAGNLKCFANGSAVGNWNSVTLSEVNTVIEIGRHYSSLEEAYYGDLQDLRITKGIARYTSDFTPPGALWRPATIGGTVTVSGNGGAHQVVIRDVATRQLAAIATPDETTGAWTATVTEGDYDITYFAPDCQPICHGPYTITA